MSTTKGYLTQYLNERRNELQELYEDIDSELSTHENKSLINDAYANVIPKLTETLSELDLLINDIESGMYDLPGLDDEMLEADF